jgi:hypothetical protein
MPLWQGTLAKVWKRRGSAPDGLWCDVFATAARVPALPKKKPAQPMAGQAIFFLMPCALFLAG